MSSGILKGFDTTSSCILISITRLWLLKAYHSSRQSTFNMGVSSVSAPGQWSVINRPIRYTIGLHRNYRNVLDDHSDSL